MVVLGEGRSRIQEVDSDKPYRQATGEDFPLPWDCSPAALATALVELSSRFHAVMVERGVAQEQLREWVDQVDEPLALLNRLAHLCLGSPGERQGYLEAASVTARLHLLQKHLGLGPRPSFN
jgi:Lon protease-like protein